jgi:hypothetical protein
MPAMSIHASIPAEQLRSESGMPLEYESGESRAARTGGPTGRELCLAIPASLFISVGIGLMIFGMLMWNNRMRDDEAGLIAGGASCITMAGCLFGLIVWGRRGR